MRSRDMVAIGEICGTHGYRGEVKVIPLTDFPERFFKMTEVWIETGRGLRLMDIENVRPHRQFLLIKFAGIESKEAAAVLARGVLMVREKDVCPLPEGTYYIYQLIGLEVWDEERGELGKLVDVITTGANDVYVVRGERYGEILLPAIKEVVLNIDLAANTMRVRLMPGLVDE